MGIIEWLQKEDAEFNLMLQRHGWYELTYKPLYNDIKVIKERGLNLETAKSDSSIALYKHLGDNTFRKILSAIFSRSRTQKELESNYGGRKLQKLHEYLAFMKEQDIAVFEDGYWRRAPRYEHVQDIGPTLEWYVGEWFRSELKAPARHGVTIRGVGDGGDLDVVAFVDGLRIIVECKSGDPANITETQMHMFLRRSADFNPAIALMLIDTDKDIDTQIQLMKKVYLESDIIGPRGPKRWNTSSVHIRNVKKSITETLHATLHSHHSNSDDGRPLVRLPITSAQLKEKIAADHIATLHRRLELQQNRPSLEQTIAAWIERAGAEDYRFCQEIFPGDSPTEVGHLTNCKILVRKGQLQAEDDDHVAVGPFVWNETKRYCANL